VVGLNPTDRHQGVTASVQGLGGEIFQLPDLVATEGNPRIAVLAFGPNIDLATEAFRQSGEGVDRRWPKEKWFPAKVIEAHSVILQSVVS
jgi:hypothetical protein